MKIALVYDRVNKWGGAERLLLALQKLFPDAPLFTSIYLSSGAAWARSFDIKSTFLQKIPLIHQHHQLIPFLMPFAFESLDFSMFDLVISVSSAEGKGIITKPGTMHICYCLTPSRYLYSHYHDYMDTVRFKKTAAYILKRLRQWDQVAARRPDYYLSISGTTQKRIKKYYGRDAELIYPPLSFAQIPKKSIVKKPGNYYLLVSRLEPYKKVELAITAFNQSKKNLLIVGRGSQENKLKNLAKANIKFTGNLTDHELFDYYRSCTALIMPQEEDFGLVSLEAQQFYKPVIAYKRGGASETVIDGKTGLLFAKQNVNSLIKCINLLPNLKPDKKYFDKNLDKFTFDIFKNKFKQFVLKKWEQYQKIR